MVYARSSRCLLLPERIAYGPNLAPGLYVTPVSNGIPRIAMSKGVPGSSRQREYGRCEKDRGPENVWSICFPYFFAHFSEDSSVSSRTWCATAQLMAEMMAVNASSMVDNEGTAYG